MVNRIVLGEKEKTKYSVVRLWLLLQIDLKGIAIESNEHICKTDKDHVAIFWSTLAILGHL